MHIDDDLPFVSEEASNLVEQVGEISDKALEAKPEATPKAEAKTEAKPEIPDDARPLPLIASDYFFRLDKNTRTGGARFTTEDILVEVEWPARQKGKLHAFVTQDHRYIICEPQRMIEVK